MNDPTAAARKQMIDSAEPAADLLLNDQDGAGRWTTEEMQRDFEVLSFAAPFVVVSRRSDGQLGSLEFTHSPRVYFGFQADHE